MIEVSHLVKKYGSHYAVNDLTFRVDRGQIYGFLGPNGAGKSTTMNIITGYLAPTSGKVKINGYDIQQEPEEAKRCIGYLPEMPPLYADMTVMEYLVFVSELKRVARKQRKDDIQDVMERTGVTEMKDRLIRNLSKGYKQRVGLARALINNPKLIIAGSAGRPGDHHSGRTHSGPGPEADHRDARPDPRPQGKAYGYFKLPHPFRGERSL